MLQISDNPAAKYISKFDNWETIFNNISELSERERQLIIIDEFPYMVKGNAAIPSILQKVWDTRMKDANVCVILCGSAMSFIEKEILSEKNPLYGRTTGILKMNPLGMYEAVQFFPDYSEQDKLAAYAILGGIPHYLLQFDAKLTLEENIIQKILSRGSVLYSEVEFLLRQELRETGTYNAIIHAIALGATKLHEINQKTLIEKSKISAYLNNLMELGLVYREFPVDAKTKETANRNRGLYRLSDPFFAFWYRYVYTYISVLEEGNAKEIWKHVISKDLNQYISVVYEHMCTEYLNRLNKEEKLPFYYTRIGRWWTKTEEIDIMACDSSNKNILLGECKYRNSKFDMGDMKHFLAKYDDTEKKVYYYVFFKSGFTKDVEEYAKWHGICLVENVV